MKEIRVSAAVIEKDGLVFATQRGYGDWKGYWEFPGGKRESGETGEETIKREIKEELDALVSVESFLTTVAYDYPTFHLTMDVYLCSLAEGELKLKEHQDGRWVSPDALSSLNWLPADILVVDELKKHYL